MEEYLSNPIFNKAFIICFPFLLKEKYNSCPSRKNNKNKGEEVKFKSYQAKALNAKN